MGVNIAEVEVLYDNLLNKAVSTLNTAFDEKNLDAETYSKSLADVTVRLALTAADLVQKQESIDKSLEVQSQEILNLQEDNLLKKQQVLKVKSDITIAKALAERQIEAITQDIKSKKFELEFILPAKKDQIEAQTDEIVLSSSRANTQLEDSIATSNKQREAISVDIGLKQYEKDVLQVDKHEQIVQAISHEETRLEDSLLSTLSQRHQVEAQTAEVLKASARADEQLSDSLLTTEKQRVLLDTQEEVETYKLVTMLPKEVDVKERQITETETMGTKNRESIDKKDAVSEAQLTLVNAQATEVRLKSVRDAAMNTAQVKELERTTARKDAESEQVVTERTEKWDKQRNIVDDQVFMSDVDKTNKAKNVALDIHQKELVAEQLIADTEFNIEKKEIMVHTRKDNIRTKAAEQFAEFLKYMSAADAVPAATDFYNLRVLISDMVKGGENPDRPATRLVVRTGYKMGKAPFRATDSDPAVDDVYQDDNDEYCNENYEILGADKKNTSRTPIMTPVPAEYNDDTTGSIFGGHDYVKFDSDGAVVK